MEYYCSAVSHSVAPMSPRSSPSSPHPTIFSSLAFAFYGNSIAIRNIIPFKSIFMSAYNRFRLTLRLLSLDVEKIDCVDENPEENTCVYRITRVRNLR